MNAESEEHQLRQAIRGVGQTPGDVPPFADFVKTKEPSKRWSIRYGVVGLYLALFVTTALFFPSSSNVQDTALAKAEETLSIYDDVLAVERAAYAWSSWESPTEFLLDTSSLTTN